METTTERLASGPVRPEFTADALLALIAGANVGGWVNVHTRDRDSYGRLLDVLDALALLPDDVQEAGTDSGSFEWFELAGTITVFSPTGCTPLSDRTRKAPEDRPGRPGGDARVRPPGARLMGGGTVEERCVARGAALLDREEPGWHERVDPHDLRMHDMCGCVLGQMYGRFDEGSAVLGLDLDGAVGHGFTIAGGRWAVLEEAWRGEIERRAGG